MVPFFAGLFLGALLGAFYFRPKVIEQVLNYNDELKEEIKELKEKKERKK
jgi:hypothetical protein